MTRSWPQSPVRRSIWAPDSLARRRQEDARARGCGRLPAGRRCCAESRLGRRAVRPPIICPVSCLGLGRLPSGLCAYVSPRDLAGVADVVEGVRGQGRRRSDTHRAWRPVWNSDGKRSQRPRGWDFTTNMGVPATGAPATCSGPDRGHPALGADTDLHKEMGAWGRAGGWRGVEVAPWRGDAQDGSAQRHVTSRRRAPPVLQAQRSCSVAPGGRPPGGTVLLEALRTLADVAENDRAGAGRPKGRHSFGLGQVPFIFLGQIEARYLSSWLADTWPLTVSSTKESRKGPAFMYSLLCLWGLLADGLPSTR